MTPDELAEKIASMHDDGRDYPTRDSAVLIAQAILEAKAEGRNEGLEEAATVCVTLEAQTTSNPACAVLETACSEIRALKDSPAQSTDLVIENAVFFYPPS